MGKKTARRYSQTCFRRRRRAQLNRHARIGAEVSGPGVFSATTKEGLGGSETSGNHVCGSPEPCVECLAASTLAAEMTGDQVDALFRIAKLRRLSRGEILIGEGESGGPLFVVARGELDVARDAANSGGVSLGRLGPGVMAGQLTFVDGAKRTATVTAASDDAWVFVIERGDVEAMLENDPVLVYRVMRAILRSATVTVDEMNKGYAESVRYIRG